MPVSPERMRGCAEVPWRWHRIHHLNPKQTHMMPLTVCQQMVCSHVIGNTMLLQLTPVNRTLWNLLHQHLMCNMMCLLVRMRAWGQHHLRCCCSVAAGDHFFGLDEYLPTSPAPEVCHDGPPSAPAPALVAMPIPQPVPDDLPEFELLQPPLLSPPLDSPVGTESADGSVAVAPLQRTRAHQGDSIPSWGGGRFRFTFRPPSLASHHGTGRHGGWQATCYFHMKGNGSGCRRTERIPSAGPESKAHTLRRMKAWCLASVIYTRQHLHKGHDIEEHCVINDVLLDAAAEALPLIPEHLLSDAVRDSIQSGKSIRESLEAFDRRLLSQFEGYTEDQLRGALDVEAQVQLWDGVHHGDAEPEGSMHGSLQGQGRARGPKGHHSAVSSRGRGRGSGGQKRKRASAKQRPQAKVAKLAAQSGEVSEEGASSECIPTPRSSELATSDSGSSSDPGTSKPDVGELGHQQGEDGHQQDQDVASSSSSSSSSTR